MFKSRILLTLGVSLVMLLMALPIAQAQPAQQTTVTPEPTVAVTSTPAATETLTSTLGPTATSVAPAVSPLGTPQPTAIGTPSTLPKTGGSDDGMAVFGVLVIIAGVALLLGALGLALSRRSQAPR